MEAGKREHKSEEGDELNRFQILQIYYDQKICDNFQLNNFSVLKFRNLTQDKMEYLILKTIFHH
jgi:hypothetical protein